MILKKNIYLQIFTALLTIIIYFISILTISNIDTNSHNYNMIIWCWSIMGVSCIIYVVYSWYILTNTLFSPYTIFLFFLTLFNFGQCLLWIFGIHINNEIGKVPLYDVFNIPSSSVIVKSQAYFCSSLMMFHYGAMMCYKKDVIKKNSNPLLLKKVIFRVCLIIAIIAVPITLYRSLNFLRISLSHGYSAIYYSNLVTQAGISMIIEIFFLPSLIGLLIGSDYKKSIVRVVYFIFAIYFILNFLQGDRGSWLYKLLPIVWLNHVYYNPINFKKAIKLVVLSIIGLYIVYAFLSIREIGLANLTIGQLIKAFSLDNSPIIQSIFEMGSSMSPLIVLLMVGNEIWMHSNSYLVAILGMPSTKIPTLLNLDVVLLENWFSQDYLNIKWGAGFSILAETFLNFGLYIGPLFMVIIGYFIGTLFFYRNKNKKFISPIKYFIIATSLASLVGWTRGSSLMFLRDWFRGTLCVVLIIMIIYIILEKYTISIDNVN